MKQKLSKKLILLFIIASIFYAVPSLSLSLFKPSSTEEQSEYPEIKPQKLYENVWNIIKEDFADQEFNNQDWEIWKNRYDEHIENREDAYKAIETMVASLGDRYTRFLDREAFEEEKESIEAELTGVGIQIGLDKSQRVVIIAPIEGTPGAKADLRPNDEIYKIDGKNTSGLSIEEAAKRIRGPVGSEVKLSIKREDKKFDLSIKRDVIPIKSIPDGQAKIIFDDIGYIRLSTFISKDTVEELLDALQALDDEAKAYIIDLRNNPGGLLNNAMIISDMFLKKGTIVSTVNKNGYLSSYEARSIISSDKPLVLLINTSSASASEIFSGALRDNGRAVLVGEKTYGKGLVQAINRLGEGSGVNVTIAKYLTPNKTDINKKGIEPDYEVKLEKIDYENSRGPWFFDPNVAFGTRDPEDAQDKQLMKAISLLKLESSDLKPIDPNILNKIAELDKVLEEKIKEEKSKSSSSSKPKS
jgi:carboxyl-terminal processing protease